MLAPSLLRWGVVFVSGVLVASSALADVVCAPLFTDHAVLQADRPLPVWGKANPGERVRVEFAGQAHESVAGADGRWSVTLAPLGVSAEPRQLVVQGTNRIEFKDVLVGEVWFCSGQSNMEKPLGERKGQRPTTHFELDLATANYPALRLFQVPRTDLPQKGPGVLKWLPTSPQALRDSNFSATAYHFGRALQQTLGVPVGIIHSSFGGTRIEAWLPPDAFADPQLAGLEKEKYPAWVPGVQPTELFASMVRPYAPYALRGFLWYQGETNLMAADIPLYAHKQGALIAGWRQVWNLLDAPFYGVLLAPFDYSKWPKFATTADALPLFWQAQVAAFSKPNSGYIVTTDLVTDLHDIHPPEKRIVGERLARLALAETYGVRGITARGPALASWRADGAAAIVTLRDATGLRTRDGLPPSHFAVAGADRVFHPATAKIDGATVRLTADGVTAPVAVRFAWSEVATPNLMNLAGLPADPFRTDDWPVEFSRPVPEEKPKAGP